MKKTLKVLIKKLFEVFGYSLIQSGRTPFITERRIYTHFLGNDFNPRVIFDVGANKGQTSLSYHKEFPDATIHAFEPILTTFEMLSQTVEGIPLIRVHHCALSDQDGEKTILTYPEAGSELNSLAEARLQIIAKNGGIEQRVTLMRGDTYLNSCEYKYIDILKTDTEGHDISVLHGFGLHLESGKIKSVICEVGFGNDAMHTSFNELHNLMISKSFVLCGIYECHYEPPAAHGYANALYCHTQHFRCRNVN